MILTTGLLFRQKKVIKRESANDDLSGYKSIYIHVDPHIRVYTHTHLQHKIGTHSINTYIRTYAHKYMCTYIYFRNIYKNDVTHGNASLRTVANQLYVEYSQV